VASVDAGERVWRPVCQFQTFLVAVHRGMHRGALHTRKRHTSQLNRASLYHRRPRRNCRAILPASNRLLVVASSSRSCGVPRRDVAYTTATQCLRSTQKGKARLTEHQCTYYTSRARGSSSRCSTSNWTDFWPRTCIPHCTPPLRRPRCARRSPSQ
jgi:hypothetical protein